MLMLIVVVALLVGQLAWPALEEAWRAGTAWQPPVRRPRSTVVRQSSAVTVMRRRPPAVNVEFYDQDRDDAPVHGIDSPDVDGWLTSELSGLQLSG